MMGFEAAPSWAEHWSPGPPAIAERFNALDPAAVEALVRELGLGTLARPARSAQSVENRVYFAGLADGRELVLKLYRPGRWTRRALLEELAFLAELDRAGVPVVRPIVLPDGERLGCWRGVQLIAFEAIEETNPREPGPAGVDTLRELGRLAARIHEVGQRRPASARMNIDCRGFGAANLELLAQGPLIPAPFRAAYLRAGAALVEAVEPLLAARSKIRVHGDLGVHNLIPTTTGWVVADLDDFANGPPLYDLCQLHRGLLTPWGDPETDAEARARAFACFLAGYREHGELPEPPPGLADGLRGLRLLWNDAWKQARLHDPQFRRIRQVIFTTEFWRERLAKLEAALAGARRDQPT